MSVKVGPVGTLADGRPAQAVDLASGDLAARVLDYGARLVLYRRGEGPNVCVASDDLADYEGELRYAGPIIGPVINRIGGARAEIAGRTFAFDPNQDGRHTLHSGSAGTHRSIWKIAGTGPEDVTLAVDLPDGEGGFPGNRRITVRYSLEDDGLTLEIAATTDAPTLMNPGSHGLWNTDGAADWSALALTIPAERFLPVTAETLPTGEIAPVEGTVYDHRIPRTPDPSLDHNFCFDNPASGLRARARRRGARLPRLRDPTRRDCKILRAEEIVGIALEPPNSVRDAANNPDFPSILLRPPGRNASRQRTRLPADLRLQPNLKGITFFSSAQVP